MCSFTFFDGLLCLMAVVAVLAGLVKLYLCHAGTEIIYGNGAAHIQSKQSLVPLKEAEEDQQRMFFLIVLGGHIGSPSFQLSSIIPQNSPSCNLDFFPVSAILEEKE